jgi:hypothetical protein
MVEISPRSFHDVNMFISRSNLSVTVKLGDSKRFSLPFRACSRSVGFTNGGLACLSREIEHAVRAFKLSGNGEWEEQWQCELPNDIRSHPRIAVITSATFAPLCLVQDHYSPSSPTVAMDGSGEVSRTHREGDLLTCIGNRAVYSKKRKDELGCEIVLLSVVDASVTLRPPPGQKWSHRLSVCGSGKRVAVVEGDDESSNPGTLHIFHQHQRKSHTHSVTRLFMTLPGNM